MLLNSYKSSEGIVVLLGALCPACGFEHSFRIVEEYWAKEGLDVWGFNGDFDSPTFDGSMLSNKKNWPGYPLCHSYLENGKWRFLTDSTHKMAGQENIPMIPVEKYAMLTKVRKQNERLGK